MSVLQLPPTPDSVPRARRFVLAELVDGTSDVDTVVLLVSEVVTNAVLHARSNIVLHVVERDGLARVEVHDSSALLPRLQHFRLTSSTGRGLRLLDQLSRSWGVFSDPDGVGKVVWFEVGPPNEEMWSSFADELHAEGAFGDI